MPFITLHGPVQKVKVKLLILLRIGIRDGGVQDLFTITGQTERTGVATLPARFCYRAGAERYSDLPHPHARIWRRLDRGDQSSTILANKLQTPQTRLRSASGAMKTAKAENASGKRLRDSAKSAEQIRCPSFPGKPITWNRA